MRDTDDDGGVTVSEGGPDTGHDRAHVDHHHHDPGIVLVQGRVDQLHGVRSENITN